MKSPTTFRTPAYTGHRRRPLRVQFIYPGCCTPIPQRTAHIPTVLPALLLVLFVSVISVHLAHPALAADLTAKSAHDQQLSISDQYPASPKNLPTTLLESTAPAATGATNLASSDSAEPTYIYISCPVEIYRGTTYANESAEYLVDDFEFLPEHWLYVLTPLDEGESYFFTLDLACRTENSRFEGQISAVYSSYVPDDGSLGSVRIEATEEISPNIFLVYYGEIKYISDGTICLTQNSYGNFYNHHLFYFSATTADLPENTQPLSEQRACRLSSPSIQAEVSIIGDAERLSDVYTEDLINSDYMYPYQKYDPANGSLPDDAPVNSPSADIPALTTLSDNLPFLGVESDASAPGQVPVEPYYCAL